MQELFRITYGSKLYGTSTPTSDTDEKAIYLPDFNDVLLGKKLQIFKTRFDAAGNPVGSNDTMPDNGIETEFIPFQTFCRDFLGGQTYALEVVFGMLPRKDSPEWLTELAIRFLTCNVASMAGFAIKQTFDYVRRGERLVKAEALLAAIDEMLCQHQVGHIGITAPYLRLDQVWSNPPELRVLDILAHQAGLEIGETENNNQKMRTLQLNGRDYLETTTVQHLRVAVQKLIASYGTRSQAAAEETVDLKSLSHAVRVFGQARELLRFGTITFPRPDAEYLLAIKTGQVPAEEVKENLLRLEAQVAELQESSELLPAKTPVLAAELEQWLLGELKSMYGLN